MYGVDFGSHQGLINHVIVDIIHQDRVQAHPAPESEDDEMTIDSLSDCPMDEDWMCLEQCCARYQHSFSSSSEYDRHIKSAGHMMAMDESLRLSNEELSREELEAKRQMRRALTCDGEKCPARGKVLSTPKSYYNHLSTKLHIHGEEVKVEKALPSKEPGGYCTTSMCPRYLHEFTTGANLRKHLASAAHVRAEKWVKKPVDAAEEMVPSTPRREICSLGGLVSPITPNQFSPLTPAGPSTPIALGISRTEVMTASPVELRLKLLEDRQVKLEEEISSLKEQLRQTNIRSPVASAFGNGVAIGHDDFEEIVRNMFEA
ncbi:hypothetical protein B0I35DRAFT_482335 [Stachybotrys elegans]|uniref:Uncharacterized protein n=1 Tax=Stachybotrys elegans TaxID=80388 RepID=A0A8K0SMB3_9HYPO|nr:hypothetical protein B0I35DRAFT_482335 [Stachybotrys elegans]